MNNNNISLNMLQKLHDINEKAKLLPPGSGKEGYLKAYDPEAYQAHMLQKEKTVKAVTEHLKKIFYERLNEAYRNLEDDAMNGRESSFIFDTKLINLDEKYKKDVTQYFQKEMVKSEDDIVYIKSPFVSILKSFVEEANTSRKYDLTIIFDEREEKTGIYFYKEVEGVAYFSWKA